MESWLTAHGIHSVERPNWHVPTADEVQEALPEAEHPAEEQDRRASQVTVNLRCKPEDLLAVVTDRPLDIGCKQFSPQEIGTIADFVESSVSKGASENTSNPVGDTN